MLTDSSIDQGLGGVATNNLQLLSSQELIHDFVARDALLDRMMKDLHLAGEGAPQHRLLIGLRGMGKTTLLCLLQYAIEADSVLQKQWLPLRFPEEQYNISQLSDLWLALAPEVRQPAEMILQRLEQRPASLIEAP